MARLVGEQVQTGLPESCLSVQLPVQDAATIGTSSSTSSFGPCLSSPKRAIEVGKLSRMYCPCGRR